MKLQLRSILIVPFVLQIFVTVGLTGWLSLRNGQKAVENIVTQLQREIGDRIEQQLNDYLQKPYIVNQNVLDAINLGYLNPEKPRSMDRYFLREIKLFAEVSVIQIANEKGEFYGINNFDEEGLIISIIDRATGYNNMNGYATDSQGKMTQKLIVSIPNFDPRRRPWYVAVATQGKSIWSPIYAFRGSTQLAITLGTPIYNQNHKLRGVVATDLVLLDINRFLSKLKIGKSGQTFILERSGLLVASSTREHPFYSTAKNQTLQRLPAINSQNQLTRLTAKFLQKHFGNFNKIKRGKKFIFKINSDRQYLQILPYKDKFGLDWLIVIVVPEKDFMAEINANTRSTIWLCIAALGTATVLGIYTSHWINQPILHLAQLAKSMSQRDLNQQVSQGKIASALRSHITELNTLAEAFNRMANQLEAAFTNLEQYAHTLEQKVADRTAELEKANQELQRLATLDGLTKVANRRYFDEYLVQEWQRLARAKQPLSLVMCDVDYFKAYNDYYGHQGGDDCLRQIALAMNRAVKRPADLLARYGGEEFVVILPNTEIQGAVSVAQAIQKEIQQLKMPHAKSDVSEYVTLSLGVSGVIPHQNLAPEKLIATADEALYEAKKQGRNRVLFKSLIP
ncbi:diguanylate cyclase [Phormidium sp. LEGE 05292]|uniref:diguanylate cyclase n=1 Tax=[Phormidium] sp. LEGE 05292 TaxID=767427 RepID=UPI001881F4C8|nr:diguanylate cyclase [Phormidium sp. LEGE 05292]MBE9227272.1 diguanylate cyclase [Phormidium sp. LEGE 05292]